MKTLRTSILLLLLTLATLAECQTHYQVTHEGRRVNTAGSETGPVMIGDTLYYTSLREVHESGGYIDFGLSVMRVMKAALSENGNLSKGTEVTIPINHPTRHTGNIAFDTRNDIVYFTRCRADSDDPQNAEIYYIKHNGKEWSKPQKLGADVNVKGFSSTQPSVGYLADGSTILYFASNRPGGLGGFDIWYSVMTSEGVPAPAVNLGGPVNTAADEITPFYDGREGLLYFSSNKEGSVGDYDVYASAGSRNTWKEAKHLPEPINSIHDDIYFTVAEGDPTMGYLASNRADSYYLHDTSCCFDIYNWRLYREVEVKRDTVAKQKKEEDTVCPCRLAKSLLPISLYFHNDEPNPKTQDTVTTLTYFQTYNAYMFMRGKYEEELEKIEDPVERIGAVDSIKMFFDTVQYNATKFERFVQLLAGDIMDGKHVVVTVGGYASPLHSSAYNMNLSKRRISTIRNQLEEYGGGLLRKLMQQPGSGSLEIRQAPFGSDTAPKSVSGDPKDPRRSIYHPHAAKERRIQILDYQYQ